MNIKPIIATMRRSEISELNLETKNINSALVINQNTKKTKKVKINNYEMITYVEKGLAKSRNRAIENLNGDEIAIVTDDDVSFISQYETLIKKAYGILKDADAIVFMSKDDNGSSRRKYCKKIKRLNKYNILSVNSIEITFKSKSILENNIRFDEDFGLGSIYGSGEENIFLMDCLKKGLKIYFYPTYINIHPKESTGFTWNEKDVFDKGALFNRLYPIMSYFISIPILFLKRNQWKNNMKSKDFISNYYRGLLEYRRKGDHYENRENKK